MGISLAQAQTLVEDMSRELQRRSQEIAVNQQYYEGDHPLKFASKEFSNYFAHRYEKFADNWVPVVAESPNERLEPIGIRLNDGKNLSDSGDLDLWRVWERNGCDADASMAFLDASIARRAFGLVWGSDDDPETPEISFESATEAIVKYEPGSRRKRAAGLKLWRDGDAEFATLYLPDERHRLVRKSGVPPRTPGGLITVTRAEAPQWQYREGVNGPDRNPMGVVPLVELPNRPRLSRQPLSDVSGVIAMQDAVNLLWSQLFTASDFSSFKQRVIIGAERPKTPILNDAGQVVGEREIPLEKFAVDRVVWLGKPDSKIAEWSADDLSVWTQVIEVAVGHIAAQTRTPQHYLIGKMANLSADALKAAETGLVKRAEEKQLYYGEAIREMFRLVCLAQGDESKARAVATGRVQWKDAESRSEAQLVDSLLKAKQMGMPFRWLIERYGLSPTEVERVMQMRELDLEQLLLKGVVDDPGGNPALPAADDDDAPRGGAGGRGLANGRVGG